MSDHEIVPEDVLISEYLENERSRHIQNQRPRLYAPQPVLKREDPEKEEESSEQKRGVVIFQM